MTSRFFWLGLLGIVGSLVGLFLLMNYAVMPIYTRQGAEVIVPEVRNIPFEQASDIVEGRDLRPERREQPFNPSLERGAVVDQNPQPNVAVKPGRRVYLYVNSGVQRMVTVPDVLTLAQNLARSELAEVGLETVRVEKDDEYSPYEGTITRQNPEAGETVASTMTVTLWASPGLGDEMVTVPDVRGMAPVDARRVLSQASLWPDPTRSLGGTVTRQEPETGAEVRQGTEVRIFSDPVEEQDVRGEDEPEEVEFEEDNG